MVEELGLKGPGGWGELNSSGSFTAFRMTAETCNGGNLQQQELATAETMDLRLHLPGLNRSSRKRRLELLCVCG
jgi:hypothetical protein